MDDYIHDDFEYSFTYRGVIVRLIAAAVVFVAAIIVEFYVASNPSYVDAVLFYNPLSTLQQSFFYFAIAISLGVVIRQSLYLMKVRLWTCFVDILVSAFSLFVSFFILDGVVALSHTFQPKDFTVSLGYIVGKRREAVETSSYKISVNTDYMSPFSLKVRHSAYKDISIGDTVLVRITARGDTSVLNYKPSREAIEKFRVPLTYVDGKLSKSHKINTFTDEQKRVFLKWSYLVAGSVYEIVNAPPYKVVRAGIADSLTAKHILEGSMSNYAKICSQIQVGSKVILRVAEANPFINEVYDWFPDSASIRRYSEPQLFDPKEKPAITIAPRKPMEVRDQSNSFYSLGRVYGKYSDENLGVHFEIGISDTMLVDCVYKKMNDAHICNYVFSGDVLIIQVASRDHRIFRVVDWMPDSATIEKYKSPVKVISVSDKEEDTKDVLWDESKRDVAEKHYLEKVYRRSHKQTGYIWALNQNSYDVGVVKNYCRHCLLSTKERELFVKNGLVAGAAVLLQVSDSLPGCNRVLKWKPTPEEVEKYKKPVSIVNSN